MWHPLSLYGDFLSRLDFQPVFKGLVMPDGVFAGEDFLSFYDKFLNEKKA